MAARPIDDDGLSVAMCALSVDAEEEGRLKELGLDDNVRAKMNEIKNEYESVFSWDIKRLTGISQNIISNLVEIMEEKCEILVDKGNVFDFNTYNN